MTSEKELIRVQSNRGHYSTHLVILYDADLLPFAQMLNIVQL
jgi:hypothetical protein